MNTAWINIHDRQPMFDGQNISNNVYFVYGYRGPQVARFFVDGHFERISDGKSDLAITHWMPIPKPEPPTPREFWILPNGEKEYGGPVKISNAPIPVRDHRPFIHVREVLP